MKIALIAVALLPLVAIVAYALTMQAAHDDLARAEAYA